MPTMAFHDSLVPAPVDGITLSELTENYLQLLVTGQGEDGSDLQLMNMVFDCTMSLEDYRLSVLLIFYKVGLIGIKPDPSSPVSWTGGRGVSVSKAELTEASKILVHKTFWRCLGISDRIDEA
jgi:hypothetical protein